MQKPYGGPMTETRVITEYSWVNTPRTKYTLRLVDDHAVLHLSMSPRLFKMFVVGRPTGPRVDVTFALVPSFELIPNGYGYLGTAVGEDGVAAHLFEIERVPVRVGQPEDIEGWSPLRASHPGPNPPGPTPAAPPFFQSAADRRFAESTQEIRREERNRCADLVDRFARGEFWKGGSSVMWNFEALASRMRDGDYGS